MPWHLWLTNHPCDFVINEFPFFLSFFHKPKYLHIPCIYQQQLFYYVTQVCCVFGFRGLKSCRGLSLHSPWLQLFHDVLDVEVAILEESKSCACWSQLWDWKSLLQVIINKWRRTQSSVPPEASHGSFCYVLLNPSWSQIAHHIFQLASNKLLSWLMHCLPFMHLPV